jgi:alpha-L-fucosidase
MHERLRKLFAEDLTQHVKGEGVVFTTSAQREIDFGRPTTISIVRLAEDITRGQSVHSYRVLGAGEGGDWQVLSSGTTIGYAKIDRLGPTVVRRLKVIAEGAALSPVSVRVY